MTLPPLFRTAIIVAIFLLAVKTPLLAQVSTAVPYAEELVQQAVEKKLDQTRYWHLLLHYKKTWFGNYESEADGMDFFIAREGKTNPRAELAAVLRSFFVDPATLKPEEDHPQCTYPARYKWLKRQLHFDPARLPEHKCERLQDWLTQLNPEKISLIFASFYMNNPASMFGHTFLLVNSKGTRPGNKLLNYGINYAATPTSTNPFIYPIMGLAGLFQGTFTVFPYFVKVQQYSNWESRDLWEYELNLTPDQINYLLLHLWELGGTWFDYFYLTENCSYHMLTILEVANPDLHLTEEIFYSVQPADTVKAVVKQKGFVSKITYRPAILNRMKNKIYAMGDKEKETLYGVIEDPDTLKQANYQQLSVPKKVLVMDTYLDYLQYVGMQDDKTDPEKPLKIPHAILLERSKLKFKREEKELIRFSSPPESAHGTDRFRLGIGANDNEFFQEIGYHPTLHDLMAVNDGLKKDSQFLFFDFAGRYYYESKRFRVDRFKLIDIISFEPYEPIFAKPSWKLNVGVDTVRDFECDYCNSFKGNGGYGFSYRTDYQSPFLIYALAEIDGETSDQFEDKFRVGGGASLGTLIDLSKNWRVQLSAMYKRFPLGDESEYFRYDFKMRYAVHRDVDLRLEYLRIDHKDEGLFSLNIFF